MNLKKRNHDIFVIYILRTADIPYNLYVSFVSMLFVSHLTIEEFESK